MLAMYEKLPVQRRLNDERVEVYRQVVYDAAYAAASEVSYVEVVELAKERADVWHCELPADDLDLVERVVMAESGNQPYAGQMAVAQCILDRMTRDCASARTIVTAANQFAKPYKGQVSDSVKVAVYAVFHDGMKVSDEPLYFFYSTVGGFVSETHERKQYVMTIDDHKFFN